VTGDPHKSRPRVSQDAVIAVLLVAIIATAGWLLLHGRHSWDPRINRAAHAVVAGVGEPTRYVAAQGPQGVVTLPARPRFDRAHAIGLALELDRLRPADAETAAASTVYMRERIGRFLKTDRTGALLVLYGLDWPWMGADPVLPEEGGPASPPISAPLAEIPGERLEQMMTLAEEAPTWPEARQGFRDAFGFSDAAAFDLRRRLVRRALQGAFALRRGRKGVREALGKYAALAPVQAESVLAMRGALALLRAGEEADGALKSISSEHPELATPIVDERRRTGRFESTPR